MKYCTVKSYMSKADDNIIISNSHWIRRKYGHMVIYRESVQGDMISLPCVICRKMIEKYDIPWTAHDGDKWVSSSSGVCMPVSRPTNKQIRVYGFSI